MLGQVDSALVTMDFTQPHRDLYSVSGDKLRKVVTTAFRQRRKMLRQSLKGTNYYVCICVHMYVSSPFKYMYVVKRMFFLSNHRRVVREGLQYICSDLHGME